MASASARAQSRTKADHDYQRAKATEESLGDELVPLVEFRAGTSGDYKELDADDVTPSWHRLASRWAAEEVPLQPRGVCRVHRVVRAIGCLFVLPAWVIVTILL
jgi:hypothetical protein